MQSSCSDRLSGVRLGLRPLTSMRDWVVEPCALSLPSRSQMSLHSVWVLALLAVRLPSSITDAHPRSRLRAQSDCGRSAVQPQGVGSPLAGATPATPEHSGRGGLFGRMGRHRRNSSSQASLVSLASIGRNESLGGPETPLRREYSSLPDAALCVGLALDLHGRIPPVPTPPVQYQHVRGSTNCQIRCHDQRLLSISMCTVAQAARSDAAAGAFAVKKEEKKRRESRCYCQLRHCHHCSAGFYTAIGRQSHQTSHSESRGSFAVCCRVDIECSAADAGSGGGGRHHRQGAF